MKKLLPFLAAAALLAAQPALGATKPARGIVVANQRGVLLVAAPSGVVHAIHGTARPGARVVLTGRRLRVVGFAHRLRLRGVVLRRSAGLTFLSVAHRVLVMHHAGRRLASAAGGIRAGDIVESTVAIGADGGLSEQGSVAVGHTSRLKLEASVVAVGNGTVTLSVNGQQLTVPLPPGETVSSDSVGQETEVEVDLGDDNSQGDSADQGDNSGQDQAGDDESGEDQAASDDPGEDQSASGTQSGDDSAQSGDGTDQSSSGSNDGSGDDGGSSSGGSGGDGGDDG